MDSLNWASMRFALKRKDCTRQYWSPFLAPALWYLYVCFNYWDLLNPTCDEWVFHTMLKIKITLKRNMETYSKIQGFIFIWNIYPPLAPWVPRSTLAHLCPCFAAMPLDFSFNISAAVTLQNRWCPKDSKNAQYLWDKYVLFSYREKWSSNATIYR